MVSRFLALQARPQHDVRAAELESMRAASGLGERLDAHPVDEADLPADLFQRYAGVVVGGSPYGVTEAEERKSPGAWRAEASLGALALEAIERDFPVFFTCYGIGVVTRALGGTVDLTHPELVSAAWSTLTPAGAADPVAGVLPERFMALTGHKESAPVVPPGAVLLATNDASPVQFYRVGSVLASQFHPEPTGEDFIARATAYQRNGYFPPEELDAIAAGIRGSDVRHPPALLARFVAVHG